MSKLIIGALAAALVAAPVAAQDDAPEQAPVVNAKAEKKLAKRLEGHVAGEPVDCLPYTRTTRATIYDETAIVYKVGSTLYVNRPDRGARQLDDFDVMVVTHRGSTRLCDIDTVELRDRSGFYSGTVFLGKFVPYRRVDAS